MVWLQTILLCALALTAYGKHIRSIDLIAAHALIPDSKLPQDVTPNCYRLQIDPYVEEGYFDGTVAINVTIQHTTNEITLHAGPEIRIITVKVIKFAPADDELHIKSSTSIPRRVIEVISNEKVKKRPVVVLTLETPIRTGAQCEIIIEYTSKINNDTTEGLFRSNYIDPMTKETKWFAATYFRPNLARNVFPCFDEPSFKVPFTLVIGRKNEMITLANMPLERTEPMNENNRVWDVYLPSPLMPIFSVAFVISEFSSISMNKSQEASEKPDIKVWARPDFISALVNVTEKVQKSIKILEEFWGMPYPLPKIDVVALPNFQATRPSDNWGLLVFKESELSGKGSWHITQELVYQWLGALATPFWWSDAHINNALVRYVTAYTTLKMGKNETYNNWPMTMLYSIYYEFSKRYPHGKSTAIKQDSTSAKTELVFRMLNYTLGEATFKRGLQHFMMDRQFKTFFGDDVWNSLTEQAREDCALPVQISVNEIAGSWITKDRLPVVTVTRDYEKRQAKVTQRVYLRERPHDVPEKEKLVWWVPVTLLTEDKVDFLNSTPYIWMKKEKEIVIDKLPSEDKFIIVNPEEIGPFPVNYDTKNWNMLANYLCSSNRTRIPVNTRAKLLHDAWNLAYAGDLSFATALNMTLFLKHERDYLAWDPVFTLIDHIGRHIDSSAVHKKFQTYVRLLLTPLYEELGNEPQEGESEGRAHLRSSSKVFLCQAGYKPCIEEAQAAFKKWMESANPDDGNPVANQYICPVFKWGTKEEWEFGLQRVIQFPPSRKQNERTYLLKTLAGCPNDAWKIERLLNITVLEQNGNFSDNDVYLIFSMLTGGANGYTTLLNFLKKNWDVIKLSYDPPHPERYTALEIII